MSLEAGIWASRLGFGPPDWDFRGGTEKKKEEKEKESWFVLSDERLEGKRY